MPTLNVWLIRYAGALAALLLFSCAPDADETAQFGAFSVLPFAPLEPGYTNDARQNFTLDLGGVGREPVKIVAVEMNGERLGSGWRRALNRLIITPAEDLRVGLNRILIRYDHPVDRRHRPGRNPVEYTAYVNYQPEPGSVRLGARGELVVDGARRFVLGGFRSGQVDAFLAALPSAAEAGLNMVHDYRFESYDLEARGTGPFIGEARRYLRRAHKEGLGVFLGLPRGAVREFDEKNVATLVAQLSGEPALWMWYVYDEPSGRTLTVENASRVYNLLRRLDPGRPAVVVTNSVHTMLQYHPFCDVLWVDRYPIIATADELISLAPIAASLGMAMRSVGPHKPVWPVLQLHDNKGLPSIRRRSPRLPMPTDETHRPTEAEIRAQAHLSIAQGAMAIVYYWAPSHWYSMQTDTPGVWRSFSRVLRELGSIEGILLSDRAPGGFQVEGGHDKVMRWDRLREGTSYVGLVNASTHTPAELTLDVPRGAGRMRQLFGDGWAEERGRRVDVRLGPAGVVVLAFGSERDPETTRRARAPAGQAETGG